MKADRSNPMPWQSGSGRVFIVAEIGKNFIQSREDRPVSEYLENAQTLVRAAKAAGADAVKFQTHWVEDEVVPMAFETPHFRGQDRYAWVRRNTNATPRDDFWLPLKQFCGEEGILFFSAPMSRGAAQILEAVATPVWKVGSGDVLDFVMLDYLAATAKPIILSSGMSTLAEVDQAVLFLKERGAEFALLHCVSKYPCPAEELSLGTIPFLAKRYPIPIGFSDHSLGVDAALAAVALGACIIEKHFSLSRDLWGSDHRVSLTPAEFRQLVDGVRELEAHPKRSEALYSGTTAQSAKTLQPGEEAFRPWFRKSLVASRDIPAGSVLTPDLIYAMRPQGLLGGIPSEEYPRVVGSTIQAPLKKYEVIQPSHI